MQNLGNEHTNWRNAIKMGEENHEKNIERTENGDTKGEQMRKFTQCIKARKSPMCQKQDVYNG